MRPPEFTGGNNNSSSKRRVCYFGFNEAAGIHRRKQTFTVAKWMHAQCFNEAAGIHRRKLDTSLGTNKEELGLQ